MSWDDLRIFLICADVAAVFAGFADLRKKTLDKNGSEGLSDWRHLCLRNAISVNTQSCQYPILSTQYWTESQTGLQFTVASNTGRSDKFRFCLVASTHDEYEEEVRGRTFPRSYTCTLVHTTTWYLVPVVDYLIWFVVKVVVPWVCRSVYGTMNTWYILAVQKVKMHQFLPIIILPQFGSVISFYSEYIIFLRACMYSTSWRTWHVPYYGQAVHSVHDIRSWHGTCRWSCIVWRQLVQ